jgi:hypothetical protein
MPLHPEEQALVIALAQPIAPPRREAFVQAVEQRLGASPVIGPGAAHRIAREVQRDYFDPPDFHGGKTGHRV